MVSSLRNNIELNTKRYGSKNTFIINVPTLLTEPRLILYGVLEPVRTDAVDARTAGMAGIVWSTGSSLVVIFE